METNGPTPGQVWNAESYARNARFVADLGEPLVALLSPKAGERVLDLGCGDGALTKKVQDLGARVVGIDASAELVLAARAAGIDARTENAEELRFDAEFDAVISNAALHWMKRPDAVIDGVFRALVPGGRFVGEMGGRGCVRTLGEAFERSLARRGIDGAARCPWYFPSDSEYAERLERRGFVVARAVLFDRPTPLPTGVRGWIETFGGGYLAGLDISDRERVIAEVDAEATAALADDRGVIVADYVRLRFVANKP